MYFYDIMDLKLKSVKLSLCFLQTHQYQCPRFPVACPNRCDPTKIPREEVEVHVQALCPSATVSCSFKEAGCKHKVCIWSSLKIKLQHYTNWCRRILFKTFVAFYEEYSLNSGNIWKYIARVISLNDFITGGAGLWVLRSGSNKGLNSTCLFLMEVWSDRGSTCKFRNARSAFRKLHVDPLSLHTSMRNKQVEFNPYIYTLTSLSRLYRFG